MTLWDMAMTVREFARSDQWEKRNETNVRSSTGDSRRSRLGIRDPDGRWDVFGWVRNLFNKDYYTRLGLAAFNTGFLTASVGDPRTGGITGRFKF